MDVTDEPFAEGPEPASKEKLAVPSDPAQMGVDDQIAAARDEDLDCFNADDVVRVRAYDPMMIAMAGSFGSNIPGAVGTTHANLIWTIERQGDFSISNGGGSLEEYFKEKFDGPAAGEDKDEEDGWAEYAEMAEERAAQQEREQWARATHRWGDIEMTGEEWTTLSKKLTKDNELGQWLLSQMKKDGKTQAQSEELLQLMRLKAEAEGFSPNIGRNASLGIVMCDDPQTMHCGKGEPSTRLTVFLRAIGHSPGDPMGLSVQS